LKSRTHGAIEVFLLIRRAFYLPARIPLNAILPFLKRNLSQSVLPQAFFTIGGALMTASNSPAGDTVGRLARDDVPFLFDALSVQPDGSIVHTTRKSLSFSFDCNGVTFMATCSRIDGQFMVTVTADLGPVPFSAESALARRAIQDLIAMGAQQAETQIAITDDQTIRIESTFALLRPVSPVVMLTAITELMLILKPTLARLAEILIEATPPVQGTA
jgi:hypothetical protein